MSGVAWALAGLLVLAALTALFVVLLRDGRSRPQDPSRAASAPQPPDAPDEYAQAYDEMARRLAPARKTTYDPEVRAGDAAGAVTKFGGAPWLPTGTTWPTCPGCARALTFFVQLDLASLPEAATRGGAGLVQLFLCTNSDGKHDLCLETWEHDSEAVALRVVDPEGGGANAPAAHAEAVLPARVVTGWTPLPDHPGYDDLDLTDIEESDELLELDDAASGDERVPLNRPGDKLRGWPYWVQNPEYARCTECNALMELLLQIDSKDNLPYMFGDAGVGHILQCPQHPHRLSWGWACH